MIYGTSGSRGSRKSSRLSTNQKVSSSPNSIHLKSGQNVSLVFTAAITIRRSLLYCPSRNSSSSSCWYQISLDEFLVLPPNSSVDTAPRMPFIHVFAAACARACRDLAEANDATRSPRERRPPCTPRVCPSRAQSPKVSTENIT
eukprot:CAMPEP_0182893332 /NCGR_PEP_ID=MMETSP0034_2-20130328/24409_1 /TAXON_ID=156128 /ORGANISM="Nephroselmis pyriformis, Strain CCMP717" /LENGTH=143 /DNA_ID=CAMNT_0025027067 /DNA_START=199 /DNA_END=630 /DNA_ORIENTATION=+